MKRKNWFSNQLTVALLLTILLALVTGTAIANIGVDGDFSGTLVGYGENSNNEAGEYPNEIVVEGEITVEGENAVNPTIYIESGPATVLDTSSINVLVPGSTSIEVDEWRGPDTVQLSAEEIPEGTTVEIGYSLFFKGGTDDSNLDAGDITIEYESPGGTPGEESFDVSTDSSNSADRVIDDLQRSDSIESWQKWLSYVGGVSIIIFALVIIAKVVGGGGGPEELD